MIIVGKRLIIVNRSHEYDKGMNTIKDTVPAIHLSLHCAPPKAHHVTQEAQGSPHDSRGTPCAQGTPHDSRGTPCDSRGTAGDSWHIVLTQAVFNKLHHYCARVKPYQAPWTAGSQDSPVQSCHRLAGQPSNPVCPCGPSSRGNLLACRQKSAKIKIPINKLHSAIRLTNPNNIS